MCEVTGARRHSPLVQDGLEIPCKYKLVGRKEVHKETQAIVSRNLGRDSDSVVNLDL